VVFFQCVDDACDSVLQSCGCFAHGILHRIKGRNLYRVSQAGRTILTAFPIRSPSHR
jgi:hypothetical protein